VARTLGPPDARENARRAGSLASATRRRVFRRSLFAKAIEGDDASHYACAVSREGNPPALSVMLIVADAAAAIDWYKSALDAGELWNLGSVAGLHLHGAPFFVHEAVPGRTEEPSPTDVGLTTTRIEVFVDEPGRFIDRAAEAGATDVEPLSDHGAPWGTHRQGGFTDPFGHRWSVGDRTPLEPFPR
jgi:PhnB protein